MSVKLGIIGAMELEISLLKEVLGDVAMQRVSGMDFYGGSFAGVDAVVVRSGIGKVNAARCTQALIDCFEVTHIINVGIGGSLDAAINIGDVVVSSDCVQHDVDAVSLGYEPGVIPEQETSFYVADESLRLAVLAAADDVASEVSVHVGRVASGDQFVASAKDKTRIVQGFGACCCEMEGAAIAQVAQLAGVPFVLVRAISDNADGTADVDYHSFATIAANRSAAILKRVMEILT